MLKELLISLGMATSTTACVVDGVAINETLVVYDSQESANNIQYQIHEADHQRQMRELDGRAVEFWTTYVLNPDQACAWEVEANTAAGMYPPDDHPACKRSKWGR